MPYNPALFTASNKPYAVTGIPEGARSYFYDETTLQYRPFASTAEAIAYLNTEESRTGHYSVFVKGIDNVLLEYWWRDGPPYNNLILKIGDVASNTVAGTVKLATDTEMQITVDTAEDAAPVKVPSRVKIYNWWKWIKTQAQTITALWTFAGIKLSTTTTAAQVKGEVWFDGTDLKVAKETAAVTNREDVITEDNNRVLAGTGERFVTANTTGGITAGYLAIEEIVTDGDIIGACIDASANNDFVMSGPLRTALIVPAFGKIMYKGQYCFGADGSTGYMFLAKDDNLVTRIMLT